MEILKHRWVVALVLAALFTGRAHAQSAAGDMVQLDPGLLPADLAQDLRSKLKSDPQIELNGAIVADRSDLVKALQGVAIDPALLEQIRLAPPDALRSAQSKVQQVLDPQAAAPWLKDRLERIRISCKRLQAEGRASYEECVIQAGGSGLQELVSLWSDGDNACSVAARAYRNTQIGCAGACPVPSASIRSSFDRHCLASLLPWQRDDRTFKADPEPDRLRAGGQRDGRQGIIDAVVLLERDGALGRSHECGGLLLSGNRVLTARHCVATPVMQDALNRGRVKARLIRDSGKDVYTVEPLSTPTGIVAPAAQDLVVLKLQASSLIPAPRVEFREPATPGAAIVLGYFAHYDSQRIVADPETGVASLSIPTWRQALRWAKPGYCHVLETVNGCVKTLCQTVPGYSGAPVFSAQSGAGAPLVVYGVLSGAESSQSTCGTPEPFATLAASAKDIQP
jgi:V8-like Glu-specific endopeptidase